MFPENQWSEVGRCIPYRKSSFSGDTLVFGGNYTPWKINILNPKMEVRFRWFSGFHLRIRGVKPWKFDVYSTLIKVTPSKRDNFRYPYGIHYHQVAHDSLIFHHGLICFHPIFGVCWRSNLTVILFNSVVKNKCQLYLSRFVKMIVLLMILLHYSAEFGVWVHVSDMCVCMLLFQFLLLLAETFLDTKDGVMVSSSWT